MPGAYRVCLETADCGDDATSKFQNGDLLGHVLVGPYIAWAGEYALVVSDDQGIAGYSLAVSDTASFEAWAEKEWWPTLREQYPVVPGDSEDADFTRRIHAPVHVRTDLLDEYPAHLHIDLLERARGRGLGRALMERQIATLRQNGVRGLHLGVDRQNVNAIEFYRHLGFVTLAQTTSGEIMGLVLS
ncbi:MAG: GNAT family N-acetyltransferase [Pseudolysinimonas sp.]